MLEKIKAMPLSVKLSILFLLGLTVVASIFKPLFVAGIVVVALTLVSAARLTYYLLD
jgi:hypothetical protein